MSEEQLRKHLRQLRQLYINTLIYGAVCFCSFLAWAVTGNGPFWPIWVFFGCGISLLVQAIQCGYVSVLFDIFPFLRPEWIEEEIKKRKTDGN